MAGLCQLQCPLGSMLSVANGKQSGFLGIDRLYIGRANKSYKLEESPLANPYTIGQDGTREQVIGKYRRWLWSHVQQGMSGIRNPVWNELIQICCKIMNNEAVTLTCWCKPEACHGDVVVRCVNWMIKTLDWENRRSPS